MPQTVNSNRSIDTLSANSSININPFFEDFVDCIENLPSRLQLLLTELRNVDVLVKARHRKLHTIKQEIISLTENSESQEAKKEEIDQLLNKLHQLLIQCQTLGDQKVRLTAQIIEIIGTKTRQLGFDARSNETKFNLEIDEDKILAEFKLACKKNRPIHHHYNVPGSSGSVNGSRSSTRHIHHNISNKPKTLHHQNESSNHLASTRSKRQLNFSTTNTSNDLPKKTLNQSLKLNKRRRLSLNKSAHQSSLSSSSSNQCKSPSSLSSSSSTSIYKSKYLTNNNTNNTIQSNHNTSKLNSQASNLVKSQKENIKYNAKLKNNSKTVKRLKGKHRKRFRKTDDEDCNDDQDEEDVDMERDYESDDEISPESEHETEKSNNEKRKEKLEVKKEIRNEEAIKDDQSDRNSNDTESINNLEDEEQHPDVVNNNQNDKSEEKSSKSKRIKQEAELNEEDRVKKKSTRISRNSLTLNEPNTITNKVIKSTHDEPLYCLCREISYGQMIMCDNDGCNIEWFHFNCVKLMSKPKGKWYCPQCRGENHKVMKKSHLINQPSTSSNLSSPNYYNNYQSSYSNRSK